MHIIVFLNCNKTCNVFSCEPEINGIDGFSSLTLYEGSERNRQQKIGQEFPSVISEHLECALVITAATDKPPTRPLNICNLFTPLSALFFFRYRLVVFMQLTAIYWTYKLFRHTIQIFLSLLRRCCCFTLTKYIRVWSLNLIMLALYGVLYMISQHYLFALQDPNREREREQKRAETDLVYCVCFIY